MIDGKINDKDVKELFDKFGKLDHKMQRWVLASVARKADSLNRKRVTRQINLSGERYKGRKNKTKKKMFKKIKQRKNIMFQFEPGRVTIRHKGRLSRTAADHQFGSLIPLPPGGMVGGKIKLGKAHHNDPCTYQQAGIIYSFLRSPIDGKNVARLLNIDREEIAKAQDKQHGGRSRRSAALGIIQDKFTVIEASRVIAFLNGHYNRKLSSRSTGYRLPKRDLLGVMDADIPVLMQYADEKIEHYLSKL